MTEYIYDTSKVETLPTQGFTGETVVRCRDCEHMHVWDVSSIYSNHDHDVVFCLRFVDGMRMTVEPDGFCAWGERKQDG